MSTMLQAKPTPRWTDDLGDEAQEPEFKPLTREEAQQWRASQPVLSPWRLVGVQWLVGLLAAVLAWLLTRSVPLAVSVLYGAAAVALPSALMAYGLTSSALSRLLSGFAQAAFAGFLFWEGVKVLLSVAMLAAAVWILPEPNWMGLLIGMVLVLKVFWFGFLLQTRRPVKNG
jgi:ATP synthase protein I